MATAAGLHDGVKTDSTLPVQLGFGISYSIIGIDVAWSFNYFLNEATDWGDDGDIPNNWETGVSVGYTLPMIPLDMAIGYLYTYNRKPKSARNDLNLNLNAHSISFGLSYLFIEKVKLTAVYTLNYYEPVEKWEEGSSYTSNTGYVLFGDVEASQINHAVSIGVEAKIL